MASKDSTQAAKARSERFQALKFDDLINMLEKRFDTANQKLEKMNAIAYGGESRAGHIKPDGDPIDTTSKFIFEAIIDIGSDCAEYYESQDLIAEMRARLDQITTAAEVSA